MSRVELALALTLAAGLTTSIGGLIGYVVRRPGRGFMGASLGFAAGVMLFVSFVQLLPQGIRAVGFGWSVVAFIGGFGVTFLLDMAFPHVPPEHGHTSAEGQSARLLRTGLFVALGIGLHNFPEGMATFVGTLSSPRLGVAIALAIAIHNIPEGLAVAAPVYAATGKRSSAFILTLLSGLAEPAGAAIGGLLLLPVLRGNVLGGVLAGIAGLMVFISVNELMPAAREYGDERLSIIGAMAGMTLMAISLWLLAIH
jgi:ZIP family zinc transporter